MISPAAIASRISCAVKRRTILWSTACLENSNCPAEIFSRISSIITSSYTFPRFVSAPETFSLVAFAKLGDYLARDLAGALYLVGLERDRADDGVAAAAVALADRGDVVAARARAE